MSKPGSPQTAKRTPGSNERIIGLLILATVVGLVFAFLVSGGLFGSVVDRCPVLGKLKRIIGVNEDKLFDLPPGGLGRVGPPVEIRVGEKLIPTRLPSGQVCSTVTVYLLQSGKDDEVVRQWFVPSWEKLKSDTVPPASDQLVHAAKRLGCGWLYEKWCHLSEARRLDMRIVDAGDTSVASKLCAARKTPTAKQFGVGRDGWQTEAPTVCGFWAGRYYTELVAKEVVPAAEVEGVAKSLASIQLVYGNEAESAPPSVKEAASKPVAAVARVADFAAVPGGQALPPTKVDRFTDNLYEKIDGKEGMFRAFHFVELRFGQYTQPQTQEAFDVYIYDMAEPVNAFGIYMGERSPTAEAWSLGRDAYVSGISVYFCKDKYYVNVLGPPEGTADKLEVSKAIATAIAGTIPDTDKPFWVEQYLPAEGRVPNSLKYEATSALGYDFIQRLFRVEYNLDGKTFHLFVVKADDAAAARSLFDRYAEATAKYDKVLSKEADAQGQKMVGESLGVFSVAFAKGVFVGGVSECEDQALAVKQAEVFRAMLPGGGAVASEPSPMPASAPAAEEQG